MSFKNSVVIQKSDERCQITLLFVSGVSFGFSAAANLASILINTSLILSAFFFLGLFLRFETGRNIRRIFLSILICFCAPGLLIVSLLYAPILLFTSAEQFNYATGSLWEMILDQTAWTLGHAAYAQPESLQHVFLGIPVSEESYWLGVVLFPFFILLPVVILTGFFIADTFRNLFFAGKSLSLSPSETAIVLMGTALSGYVLMLLFLDGMERPVFSKDRTGLIPMAYLLMLLPLLLHRCTTHPTLRRNKVIPSVLAGSIFLLTVHFLSLSYTRKLCMS
ncbi:MAG: hypothetical protein LBQ54_09965 [Planctomycetaceae bacterium]|jgi:hypothetical protein|nr:hypothetical protein [Planctomycetaceae bacterium]